MKNGVLLATVVVFTSIKYSIGTSLVEPVAAGHLGNELKEFPRKKSSKTSEVVLYTRSDTSGRGQSLRSLYSGRMLTSDLIVLCQLLQVNPGTKAQ